MIKYLDLRLKNYKDRKKHGTSTRWYENGQKKYEQNYKNGEPHGLGTKWYERGKKKKK